MSPEGSVLKIAAAAAIVAAVSLSVVAGGYALFLVARDAWGAPAAAGVVAGCAILLAAIVGLIVWLVARTQEIHETKDAPPPLSDYLIDMALARPVTTAAIAAAAGWICLRNPRLVSLALELAGIGGLVRRR